MLDADVIDLARKVRDSESHTKGDIELSLFNVGKQVIGVDEVGRGCLAGPVYAAAVILDFKTLLRLKDSEKKLIRDSKSLSSIQRAKVLPTIYALSKASAVGESTVREIETLGILGATFLAMHRAIAKLSYASAFLLVDGNMPLPDCPIPQLPVIKGDGFCFAIAAASILAKEARDTFMRGVESTYPGYGFGSHVGYGTKTHIDAIYAIGPCPLHRRSFAPIRDLVGFQQP